MPEDTSIAPDAAVEATVDLTKSTGSVSDVQTDEAPATASSVKRDEAGMPIPYTLSELKELGMKLRLNQLHGWTGQSGEARFWRALGFPNGEPK